MLSYVLLSGMYVRVGMCVCLHVYLLVLPGQAGVYICTYVHGRTCAYLYHLNASDDLYICVREYSVTVCGTC